MAGTYDERHKRYYEKHKEEIAKRNKDYLKEYYKKNKEKILKQQREYQEEHKESIRQRLRIRGKRKRYLAYFKWEEQQKKED
jgi:hypothetical protein